MLTQVFFGSCLLVLCALIHVGIITMCIPLLKALARRFTNWAGPQRVAGLLTLGIGVLLAAHSIEIWLWAAALHLLSAFDQFATSFYFATVTYTTLGYGDLVLGESLRIFASFCAIAGLLTFGISTAFLIGLLTRILPDVFTDS